MTVTATPEPSAVPKPTDWLAKYREALEQSAERHSDHAARLDRRLGGKLSLADELLVLRDRRDATQHRDRCLYLLAALSAAPRGVPIPPPPVDRELSEQRFLG
jgi:hypothetical protein